MREQNNLGRQYTDAPNFGKTYPRTQYKGYAEEEGTPYGGANAAGRTSTMHRSQPGTQYGYTQQYQGYNPQHSEARFEQNNQSYGGDIQYRPNMQSQPMSQPQGRSGMSQLQYQNQNTAYPIDRYQGLSQYQSGTIQAQDLGRYESGASGMANQYPGSGAQYPAMGGTPGTINSHDQLEQTGQIQTATYNDRDRVNDLLASEKYLTEGYNVSTFEATNPQLQNTLRNILSETHRNRETLYQAMDQRGWYKSEQADQQQITQAYNKFNQYKNQLPF